MNFYPLALFAHLLGVLGLFINLGLQWTSVFRLRRARTLAQVREWTSLLGGLGMLGPASGALLLVAGMYMTATAWGLGTPWILVSLVTLLVLMALGMAVPFRRLKAIRRAVAREETPDDAVPPAVQRQIHDPLLWTSVQAMGSTALGIVFLMTIKPGLDSALLVLAVAFALGVVSAQPWRHPRAKIGVVQEAHLG